MKLRPSALLPLAIPSFLIWLGGGDVCRGDAGAPPVFTLQTNAQVTGEGITLAQVVRCSAPLPDVILAPAPPIGRPVTLSREQIWSQVQKLAPDFATTNWSGADRV